MEVYADDLKYFEPDNENKTNVDESIDKVKNNANDLKAPYIYLDSKLSRNQIYLVMFICLTVDTSFIFTKNHEIWTFKVNFLCQKTSESF